MIIELSILVMSWLRDMTDYTFFPDQSVAIHNVCDVTGKEALWSQNDDFNVWH